MTEAAPRSGEAAPRPTLGVIGGSAFLEIEGIAGAELLRIETARGVVPAHVGDGFAFLQRHGEGVYRPPHRIPHHAHVLAMEALGVRHVAGFASSGSLHADLLPGSVVVPDDYVSWHDPPTFAEDDYLHIVPALDPQLRALLVRAAEAALGGAEDARGTGAAHEARAARRGAPAFERGGVYVETRGPRFETAAEVRVLAAHARVVGMTAASEATLFQERGIGYAMLCTVDNWANGVGEPLTLELFQAQVARSSVVAREIFGRLVALWRGEGEGSG